MASVMVALLLGSMVSGAVCLYLWAKKFYRHWAEMGVIHPEPTYFLGNSRPLSESPSELYHKLYQQFPKEKYVGFYDMNLRKLLVRDPELVQKILVKDFSSFTDRVTFRNEDVLPADRGMFVLRAPLWRSVRNRLSPAFTSGKLKHMMPQMEESYLKLKQELGAKSEVNLRDVMFGYTSDVIAGCAFGIDIKSDPSLATEFRRVGQKAFHMTLLRQIRIVLMVRIPMLAKVFKMSFMPPDVTAFLSSVYYKALEFRRRTGTTRNDFVQLIMQIQDKGALDPSPIADPDEQFLYVNPSNIDTNTRLDDELLMAQALTFLTAGLEPSANSLLFTLLELARDPALQQRAREEVLSTLAIHGRISYQALKDMSFLDLCIYETLRLYPVAKQLMRVCTKPWSLGKLKMYPGDTLVVPVKALHTDPAYFPKPLEFLPDRFDRPCHPPAAFQPFGDGPRICIGMRFALLEMKILLANILQDYSLALPESSPYPVPLNQWSFFTVPSVPIKLIATRIQN